MNITNSNIISTNIQQTPLQKIYRFATNQIACKSKKLCSEKIFFFVTAFLIISGFITVAFYFRIEFYLFLIALALPLLWTMVNYPRIWIYFIVLSFTVFLTSGEKEVNAFHILAGLFYNSFLILWFINKLLIKREKISRGIADQIFLFFYFVLLANSIIAVSNNVIFFDWFREYLLFSLILYYFPIREYFNTKKQILILIALIACSAVFLDLYAFYNYFRAMKDISYAYQFAGNSSMRINQQIFTSIGFSAIALFFYFKTLRGKLFSFLVAILTVGALVSTLSRAFWVAFIVISFVFLFYLKIKQIIQLFVILIAFLGVSAFTVQTIMPDKAELFQKYLVQRFTSTSKGKKDQSVRARLYEYKEVVQAIENSPLWGHGLRKEFMFYNNITQQTSKTSFIHNGYMNILYKTGLPLALAFYVPILLYLFKGFLISIRTSSSFYRTLAICGYLTLAMLFITNFATSSFLFRDGLMITALAMAVISIAEKNIEEKQTDQLIN